MIPALLNPFPIKRTDGNSNTNFINLSNGIRYKLICSEFSEYELLNQTQNNSIRMEFQN